jgi:hypothetical protein
MGMVRRIDWRDDGKFNTVSGIFRMYLDDQEQSGRKPLGQPVLIGEGE